MLNHYLVLAVKVLLRRKFFTFISLFGISFTLLVLTVVTSFFDHSFGPASIEPRQGRTLYIERAVMYGPRATWSGS
ncbi:MAG: ABC transporter permease, partial [Acidobacteriota bacterium]